MDSIADSNAAREPSRMWPQHQSALMLLQTLLTNPKMQTVKWLDLACGRGQILIGLTDRLLTSTKDKIEFTGYDLRDEYAKETDQLAASSGFRSHRPVVGDLGNVYKLLGNEQFDFITFTNTVHEIQPQKLGVVFVDAILRLSNNGTLFIYDLEKVEPPELGAVPWTAAEVTEIIQVALKAFEVEAYDPPVAHWPHRSTNGWSLQINRDHLTANKAIEPLRLHAEKATRDIVCKLLMNKLIRCRAALENLTAYGSETAEEQNAKQDLLYEFWALSRALENK